MSEIRFYLTQPVAEGSVFLKAQISNTLISSTLIEFRRDGSVRRFGGVERRLGLVLEEETRKVVIHGR